MGRRSKGKSKRNRRTFKDDFKRDPVNLVVVEGYSFQRAANAVGVNSGIHIACGIAGRPRNLEVVGFLGRKFLHHIEMTGDWESEQCLSCARPLRVTQLA